MTDEDKPFDKALLKFIETQRDQPNEKLQRWHQKAIAEKAVEDWLRATARRGWSIATTLNVIIDMLTKIFG